jgi:mannose-6-phosphate isomerase-like protein (cupin superfamily)
MSMPERERERERERDAILDWEPEPDELYCFWSRDKQNEHLASLPRVIGLDEAPRWGLWKKALWRSNAETGKRQEERARIFIDYHYYPWEKMQAPIYTMTVHGSPGRTNPHPQGSATGHRHFFEAIFYYGEGQGREEQDGVFWPWEGEGILCVPTFTYHKHHHDVSTKTGIWTVISQTFESLGTAHLEQITVNPALLERFNGQAPSWLGVRNEEFEAKVNARRGVRSYERAPTSTYERFLALLPEENRWYSTAPRWISAESVPWEDTPQGRIKYMVHPWSNSCIKTLDVYIQEIAPRSRSGQHRHMNEEVFMVSEGAGYIVQDGVRYDFKEDCLVMIPTNTTHQIFNSSDTTLKFVSVNSRWHFYSGYGGVEQLEDAPEWSA